MKLLPENINCRLQVKFKLLGFIMNLKLTKVFPKRFLESNDNFSLT